MEGIILQDDARYRYTENYLRNKGYIFHTPDAPPEDLDLVIFPFKEEIDRTIYDNRYFSCLGEKTIVFSGIRNRYISEKCAGHGLLYHVMMEDRGTQIKNAVPTSEGVISYIIANNSRTAATSRILVIGYGVCGRDLSMRLRALGADVYALVRNREKECAAYADSVTPLYLKELRDFDIIVNTVPERVLTDEMLAETDGAILIDIASKPYGFNMELAKKLNEKSVLLPGIPGKYAVCTAGEILGEYIHQTLMGREQK